ncbi:Deoxyribodipyrimidine photo-lyase [Sesamum angolense]|uniref:Deoxyribodipyrimidine photo-lyase n=1 Tax=Sesamum angolense TaxID=2727404 RepID=A0AAE1W9V1_9LAMI|nr:Deoxyribodipyrimidine photo-lyase [Sesamum angolense]
MSSSIPAVQPGRIRVLKQGTDPKPAGPVVYWMFRDQRLRDNWALIHAVHQANKWEVPVAIAFNLFHQFKGAKARQLGFMLRGLKKLNSDLQSTLETLGVVLIIQLEICLGLLVESWTLPALSFLRIMLCGILIKFGSFWSVKLLIPFQVFLKMWSFTFGDRLLTIAGDKVEYGARTIRSKINKKLPEYLIDYPELITPQRKWASPSNSIDWDNLIARVVRQGAEVPELEWCRPGEQAASDVLMGDKTGFLKVRVKNYFSDRNNPLKSKALSGLSPYLHFGQISAQRCALEARKVQKLYPQAIDAFLEELIVRRELADNFCFYQPHYDSLQGAWEWARKTLMDHASDKREHIYTREQLEKAQTADPLWNASQLEMVHYGKMHGFMRMYWAKKILEWTSGPEEALATAIYLNDKYQIDGRDPNGYVGCMWSICGVHDQGWQERPVFGKIRYMNYAGCKRKFDVDGYIAYIKRIVSECKKRKAEQPLLNSKAKELRS